MADFFYQQNMLVDKFQKRADERAEKRMKFDEAMFGRFFGIMERFGDQQDYFFERTYNLPS